MFLVGRENGRWRARLRHVQLHDQTIPFMYTTNRRVQQTMLLKTVTGISAVLTGSAGLLAYRASTRVTTLPGPPTWSLLASAEPDPRFKLFLASNSYKDAFSITVKKSASDKPRGIDDYATTFFSSLAFLPERTLLPFLVPKEQQQTKITKPGTWSVGDIPVPPFEVIAVSDSQILLSWHVGTFETAKSGGFTWLAIVERDGQTELFFGSGLLGSSPVDKIPWAIMEGHRMYSRVLLWSAARSFDKKG